MLPRYRTDVANKITISKKKSNNKRKTTEQYRQELAKYNPNIEVLEEYVNAKTKILHRYKNCGHLANVPPDRILRGSGCDICNRKNVGQKFKKTTDQYKKELSRKNAEIEVLENYIDAKTKIKHRHKICGTVWNVTPSSILNGTGCPKCAIEINAKKKTLSDSQFRKKIIKPITVLSAYVNNHAPVICQCKICSYIWNAIPSDLMLGTGCPNCAGNIKKTHIQFIKEISSSMDSNISVIGIYNDAKTPIECQCKICKTIFKAMPYNLKLGTGCKKCADRINGKLRLKNNLQFIDELKNKNSNVEVLGQYLGANSKIEVQCTVCKNVWSPIASSLLCGTGCPSCKISHGEKCVQFFLDKNNITYHHPAKFDNLIGIGGRHLSYDFYLPQYNLLIEFQGEQHERPVEHFGGVKKFVIQKIHDTRKRRYAHEHNISLLEIWYYENNKIDKILTQTLNNLKSECRETVIPA